MLRLTAATREAILNAAAATPDREVCGLLVEAADEIEAHQSPNRHPDPRTGFAICDAFHARLQRSARARHGRIIGCFHSHPSGDAAPSETDLLAAQDDGFIWLVCTPDGRLGAWRARIKPGLKYFEPLKILMDGAPQSAIAAERAAH